MTDLGTLESPQAAPPSTVLDAPVNNSPSGAGAPKLTPDGEADKFEPKSAADTLREVFKENKEPEQDEATADTEDDDKAAKEVKEEKKPAKPAKEAKEDVEGDEAEQGEEGEKTEGEDGEKKPKARYVGRDNKPEKLQYKDVPPPSRFLPDAKEAWANAPYLVRRDVSNMEAEYEAELKKHAEATERYEAIRDFDELARQNGRDLRDSLMRVHQIENELQSNPIAGLNRVLMEAGPRKADGQPVSLYELAQFIVSKGPQGYQQMVAQQPQQQQAQQPNHEVAQLKQQLAQMQHQQIEASVIAPFRESHPRYDELQDDIAFFLKSGKIPKGLDPADRLEAAYFMAERINPLSKNNSQPVDSGPLDDGTAGSFADSKSIKSAPGAVSSKMELERGGSIRDILEQERKRLRRS